MLQCASMKTFGFVEPFGHSLYLQDAVHVQNEGGRDLAIMCPGILDLSANMSWPLPGGLALGPQTSLLGTADDSGINCGYAQSLLLLPGEPLANHLQIRRMRLASLSQGPAEGLRRRRLLQAHTAGSNLPSEWTLLLWFIKRYVS